jgi:hypothetical protein
MAWADLLPHFPHLEIQSIQRERQHVTSTRRLKSFGSLDGPRMALLADSYHVSIGVSVY